MRKTALSCLLPVLLAVAGPAAADNPAPTQVYLIDGELAYAGKLDPQANARLFALYDSLKDKPAVLSILSQGGEVDTGMALGSWVREHKLDVKVLEYCLSSCANYVFPAGTRKIVSNFAVIGFHGGVASTYAGIEAAAKKLSPEQQALFADVGKSLRENVRKEEAYLTMLGVRADLVSLGQQEQYRHVYRDDPAPAGWTYSLEDFARLGVGGIDVINPPWKPGAALKQPAFYMLKPED